MKPKNVQIVGYALIAIGVILIGLGAAYQRLSVFVFGFLLSLAGITLPGAMAAKAARAEAGRAAEVPAKPGRKRRR